MHFLQIFKERDFYLSLVITLLYFGLGYLLLQLGWAEYSVVLFILLPITIGVAIGSLPITKWLYIGLAFGLLIFLGLLIVNALEGLVCILMALPIIILFVFVGISLRKFLLKKGFIKPKENDMNSIILPIVVMLFGFPIEKMILSNYTEINEVRTVKIFSATPEQVYDAIKSVDTVIAEKPFLMKLDLPIPKKCILEKEEVGAKRVCHFENGAISEEITELDRGKILRMNVLDSRMVAPGWIEFKEAIYVFEPFGANQCQLTRISTYTSKLKPRWYWRFFERLGIGQEHDYVFANLEKDLKENTKSK